MPNIVWSTGFNPLTVVTLDDKFIVRQPSNADPVTYGTFQQYFNYINNNAVLSSTSQVNGLEAELNLIKIDISNNTSNVNNLLSDVSDNAASIQNNIAVLNSLTITVNGNETNITNLQNSFSVLNSQVSNNTSEILNIDNRLSNAENEIDNIQLDEAQNRSDIDTNVSNIASNESRITANENAIAALEGGAQSKLTPEKITSNKTVTISDVEKALICIPSGDLTITLDLYSAFQRTDTFGIYHSNNSNQTHITILPAAGSNNQINFQDSLILTKGQGVILQPFDADNFTITSSVNMAGHTYTVDELISSQNNYTLSKKDANTIVRLFDNATQKNITLPGSNTENMPIGTYFYVDNGSSSADALLLTEQSDTIIGDNIIPAKSFCFIYKKTNSSTANVWVTHIFRAYDVPGGIAKLDANKNLLHPLLTNYNSSGNVYPLSSTNDNSGSQVTRYSFAGSSNGSVEHRNTLVTTNATGYELWLSDDTGSLENIIDARHTSVTIKKTTAIIGAFSITGDENIVQSKFNLKSIPRFFNIDVVGTYVAPSVLHHEDYFVTGNTNNFISKFRLSAVNNFGTIYTGQYIYFENLGPNVVDIVAQDDTTVIDKIYIGQKCKIILIDRATANGGWKIVKENFGTSNTIIGATHTLELNNNYSELFFGDNSVNQTLTIEQDSTINYPLGFEFTVTQEKLNPRQISIIGQTNVVFNCADFDQIINGTLKTRTAGSSVYFRKTSINTWYVKGDYTI